MKKTSLLLLVVFCCIYPEACYALNWKNLHEAADKKSLPEAKKTAEDRPSSIDELYILGLVYLNAHKDDQAREAFEKIRRLDPRGQEARWGLAEILRRQGKVKESQEILDGIVSSYPDFAPAYISLAYIKYTLLNFKKALDLAQRVIDRGRGQVDLSNYVRAYLIVGGSKGMLARRGGPIAKVFHGLQVLPTLKKAEKLQPDAAAVLLGLGSFYFLAPPIAGGDKNKAISYLERAIKTDPLLADAYVRLAQVYKVKGFDAKAESFLRKALEIEPQNALALDASSKKCKFACVGMED